MFVTLTEGVDAIRRRGIILQSVTTASVVAVAFLWLGPVLLRFLGISVPDFMIAGGILLLAIALSDLLTGVKRQREPDPDSPGAVPIGVPLITGPAVLTTCILLRDMHGRWATTAAVVVNIALAGAVFLRCRAHHPHLGQDGHKDGVQACQPAAGGHRRHAGSQGRFGGIGLFGRIAIQCRTWPSFQRHRGVDRVGGGTSSHVWPCTAKEGSTL